MKCYLQHFDFSQSDFLDSLVLVAVREFLDRHQLSCFRIPAFCHISVTTFSEKTYPHIFIHLLKIKKDGWLEGWMIGRA